MGFRTVRILVAVGTFRTRRRRHEIATTVTRMANVGEDAMEVGDAMGLREPGIISAVCFLYCHEAFARKPGDQGGIDGRTMSEREVAAQHHLCACHSGPFVRPLQEAE